MNWVRATICQRPVGSGRCKTSSWETSRDSLTRSLEDRGASGRPLSRRYMSRWLGCQFPPFGLVRSGPMSTESSLVWPESVGVVTEVSTTKPADREKFPVVRGIVPLRY